MKFGKEEFHSMKESRDTKQESFGGTTGFKSRSYLSQNGLIFTVCWEGGRMIWNQKQGLF